MSLLRHGCYYTVMVTVATIPANAEIDVPSDLVVDRRRLDPRIYLAAFISVAVWVSMATGLRPLTSWAIGLLSLALVRNRRDSTRSIPMTRLLSWIGVAALVTFLLHLIFAPDTGGADFSVFGARFELAAARLGGAMALRLIALVLLSFALLSFVSALDLAAGITRLLLRLRRIGVPAMSFFYLSFFLVRMVPGLVEESRLIGMAQRSRGVAMNAGRFHAWRAFPALIIPIFASALRRSDQMALAFASRGFDERHVPFQVTRLQLGRYDCLALGILMLGWLAWLYMRL